jgi:hypothetical protein
LGEATNFPLIVYYVAGYMTIIQMTFFPGLPSGSLEISKVETPTTLKAHNFVFIPSIEMRFEAKL